MKQSINPELELADEFVRDTGCNIYLTGKAGTGKTTFLHNLKLKSPKRMIVTAPTGVAAINAGGVTIHSFFQMPFGPFVPGSESSAKHKFSKEKVNIIKSLDLLVIDEISMVRADLLDGIDHVLRRYRRSHMPFGGVQLLLIGDLHQLSPVVKDADWRILNQYYDSPFFFSSNSLRQTELISIELRHIYRQEDDHFIGLLNQVRDNNLDQVALDNLNGRYIEGFAERDHEQKGYITLCTHNNNADKINNSKLTSLQQKSYLFSAEIEGEFPEHSFPTTLSLELKPQAQVMFMRNDSSPEKRFFNGKIGKITRIAGEKIWIKCPDDNDEIMVEPVTWENIEYSLNQETLEITENKIGAFIQYPLKLAWAITIHKSQGLTFDRAIIDAQAAFAHGQVYVALSRCRTLEGMVLSSPLSRNSIKTDRTVLRFVEEAGKDIPTAEKLGLAKIRYQQQLLLGCFDFQELQILITRLVSLVDRNPELLRILGAGDLHQLRQQTVNDICSVGANFRRQLQGLMAEDILPAKDPSIVERLEKASSYFQDKFATGLGQCVANFEVETDNKEMRKKAKNLCKRLHEESVVKLAGVVSCAGGFSASDYLRAISSAEITAAPKTKRETKNSTSYSEADIVHPELFEILREWRGTEAKDRGVPHYQIMHQKTLVQLVVNLPDTIKELMKIKGIGKKLSEKYGDELVAMISTYREKHNIVEVILPPVDETKEDTAKKSKTTVSADTPKIETKQLSFTLFNEGLSPSQIADKRDMVLSTIESHLAHFIATGDLPISGLISTERQEVIEKKLKEMSAGKLSEIKMALGGDYNYGEIKFVQAHLKHQQAGD